MKFRNAAQISKQICVVVGVCIAMTGQALAARPVDLMFRSGMDEPVEGPYTEKEAARFLTQATFGPTIADIENLQRIGYNAWFDQQYAATTSLQLPFLDGLINAVPAGQPIEVWQDKRIEVWFANAQTKPDQLRQRTAWALSQIFVVSDQNGAVEGNPTTLAHYYDLLAQGAFGSYRTLLENVTLHPSMGRYLSMHKNEKENTVTNTRPDENYAREIMQLFSIGLVMLNNNGTVINGTNGQPAPTYTQDTIRNFARVFTGWNYSTCEPPTAAGQPWKWQYCPTGPDGQDWRVHVGWRTPMKPWGEGTSFGEVYHDVGAKQLLSYASNNGVVAAGGTARADLTAALNNLAGHPNVAPFMSRLLIQRFTTSNPSAAYINRVATVWNNNGAGVRGDLRAVVKAILMDSEARNAPTGSFGKIREPLLRITQLWRALNARSVDGRIREGWTDQWLAQAPMRSPTVFNFYLPSYQLPGPLATAGLYAPEFQITTDTFITRYVNEFDTKTRWAYVGNTNINPAEWDPVKVDYAEILPAASNATNLVELYNLLFMQGRMSPAMKTILINHVNDMPSANATQLRERASDALWLLMTSAEYIVEK